MNSPCSPSSAWRVAGIAAALCRAVGDAFGRGLMQAAMTVGICRRIQRVRMFLLVLEARFLAGALVARARNSGPASIVPQKAATPDLAAGGTVRLPRRFGWLCTLIPGDAACFAGQLRVVLAEPGMVAMLASCPQAVAVLRPLCRMLGIAAAEYTALPCGAVTAVVELAPRPERQPAPSLDEGCAVSRQAQEMAGMAWVRFIPV